MKALLLFVPLTLILALSACGGKAEDGPISKDAAEDARNKINNVANKLSDGAEKAKEKAAEAAKKAEKASKEAAKKAEEASKKAAEKSKEAGKKLSDKAKDLLNN